MSVVTLPFEGPKAPGTGTGTRGIAEISFRHVDGESRLDHLYQTDPLRVLFPTPPEGDAPTAAIVTTAGGLVGGDALELDASVDTDATALVMAQAAEKVYRSAGPDVTISVRLEAAAGAWLEWLPQETILFEGARMRRLTAVDAAPGARVFAGEMLVFGRRARGEQLTGGLVREAWEVRRDGRLAWADALFLDGDVAARLADSAGFDGAAGCATAIFAADDAAEHLGFARARLGDGDGELRTGATAVNGLLLVRWLARDALRLRQAFGAFWADFRHAVGGLPRELPRLWSV